MMKIEKLNNFSEKIFIVSVFVSPHERSDRVEVLQAIGFANFLPLSKKFTQKLHRKEIKPVSEKIIERKIP